MAKKEKASLLTRIVESKPPIYWWILLNISMGCLAVMSWIFFLPTFNYPEEPKNYESLILLGRTPKLPAFEGDDAPDGTTLEPADVHAMFTSPELTEETLDELNTALLRNYIKKIKSPKLNYYIKGKYMVSEARALTAKDLFSKGIVVKARSHRQLEGKTETVPFLVEVEYTLPGVSPSTLEDFKKGQLFDIFKVPHYCALLHVKRIEGSDGETVVRLSIVPIVIDSPIETPNGKPLKIKIPERIYPANPLPIFQ